MINVLFVCLGNICRSPMADGVFQHLVQEAGLMRDIAVDSAGTGGYHIGETAHRGTLAILKKHGIPYNGRARQFSGADLNDYDYVLAMDRSNLTGILRYVPDVNPGDAPITLDDGTEIAMFLSYANQAGTVDVEEVPDPYYTGGFDYVYDLVRKGSIALLDHIREKHGL
jgi:protein-tyrosine phosphatase